MSQTTTQTVSIVILAAGKGTRMNASTPKVLHEIAGRTLIGHVLGIAQALDAAQKVVVIAPDMEDVASEVASVDKDAICAIQEQQNGTGDAVKAGLAGLKSPDEITLVLYADTPLITANTLQAVMKAAGDHDMALLGFEANNPKGYGRLIRDDKGDLSAIVEEADANAEQRAVTLCNSGVMAFKTTLLADCLAALKSDNAAGEYYLTDCVAIARAKGVTAKIVTCPERDVQGVNTQAQLALCEAQMQTRLRDKAMTDGVHLEDPASVFLSHDTSFGRDVVVEPNVVFKTKVTIGNGVVIKAFSHLEGAVIGDHCIIGPFARLRPGARLDERAKLGNFVEVKAAHIEAGAKINHLSYIGDARVGPGANIGAGTITCNYDGFNKHFSDIGANAFIGSNSALVAPVKIGEGAIIGAGSVVTGSIEADALALTRAPLSLKPSWAVRFRAVSKKKKQNKT